MKALPKDDLKEGRVYKDLLSGKNVLVTNKRTKTTMIMGKKYDWITVDALIYNDTHNNYNSVSIENGQLINIE